MDGDWFKVAQSPYQTRDAKMGFVRTVIPFKGMKSQTHTRQIFLDRNVSNLKCCGKRENRVANKW